MPEAKAWDMWHWAFRFGGRAVRNGSNHTAAHAAVGGRMKIVSLATSLKKGTRKTRTDELRLVEDHGVEGDAHAGPWHRQVSFLAAEQIEGCVERGLNVDFGDFAENVASVGVDWKTLPLGDARGPRGRGAGPNHADRQGMPQEMRHLLPGWRLHHAREGVFGRVLKGGLVRVGDEIRVGEAARS
jgi:MOSC domain-containing protein YiiM